MGEQLSLGLAANEAAEQAANPLAEEVWRYALQLGFDAKRFKAFVVAGWQLEVYDRAAYLTAKDEYLLPLLKRLSLIEAASARHFPKADERQFWTLAHDLGVPHYKAAALRDHWSFDGWPDWPGAAEEMLGTYGWDEHTQAA